MQIVIPTRGRKNNQLTLRNLPRELQAQSVLVCPAKERLALVTDFPHVSVIVQPDDDIGIAKKRQWIMESWKSEKLVMLDDDLRFAVRRDDDPGLFRKAELTDISRAFKELEEILSEDVPHAGFSARGSGIGDSAKRGGWQDGKRMMYVLGYHVPTVNKNAEFGRISTHEDIDICLQLLLKGFPNKVNFSFVVDQKFGSPGGCTGERTIPQNNLDCEMLANLHPGYIRLSQKEYTSSTPRLEVVCAWQKAMNDGILKYRQFGR